MNIIEYRKTPNELTYSYIQLLPTLKYNTPGLIISLKPNNDMFLLYFIRLVFFNLNVFLVTLVIPDY